MIQSNKLKSAAVAALAVFALALTGCSSDDSGSDSSNSGSSSTQGTGNTPATSERPSDSNREEQATFTMTQNGVEMTLVYYYVGDEVTRQTTRNVIDYAAAQIADDDEARSLIEPLIGQFQGVRGLTHNMEYTGTSAIETLEVDYSVADLAEISQLMGSSFEGNLDSGKLSMEQSRQMLLQQGFTEVN